MTRLRPALLLPLLAAAALAAFATALAAGSVPLGPAALWDAVTGAGDPLATTIVHELRLPRAVAAFVVGALLALAGALMQALLGNPLADPYVLGTSGGAAFGSLLTLMLFGTGGTAGALAGAALAVLVVFGLGRSGGRWAPTTLLLTGIVTAAGWGAGVSFLLAVAPERDLRGMVFWLLGDLGQAELPVFGTLLLVLALLAARPAGRVLNLLARGELEAGALGVDVPRVRLTLYFVASLLTAAAVTVAGTVGFVGLVVPHLLRLLGGGDHRLVLPGSILLGGTLLVLADTAARTLLAPQQLPVGVVTALIGVPLFLYLLRRGSA